MCNLYRLKRASAEIADIFRATGSVGDLEKDYVSPGREGWVVRNDQSRIIERMAWGWPNPRGGRPVVNVRNYESPFWRSALANPARRCLVPFTEFQEWSAGPDPMTGKKRPHWFSLPSRPVAAFAGIWRPSELGPIYAFLTTGYDGDPNNHVVGAIHPKAMPVVLHDEDYDRWLDTPIEEALVLATAFPSQLMTLNSGD
ncbi:SOS response-associated peptidase [Escherichia coli]|uniref:SOS response-associated peptidase n=1 Tax=Escherichia coli TaxID=562 RepID=UPI001909953A|nr:SOS response-associated peptidase family protein [Escherichia coli]MBK2451635.1 DUF159 family protein [Escherichia coli]